ncbi:hypothetical protein DL546_003061 [Coniochaeta pulveracea]|uniref:WW domain-containing protein n=1 Tax=Coniochaeta pulveracea TaxID=177199 RepID=A0A420XXI8_9PEZI|nr:hypothetical protein DL546_003061 [Coniochaeta pulveracea]
MDDAPPSYEQATGSSSASQPQPAASSTLQVPSNTGRNGIPADSRRSMEDEGRPLPPGWIRCFDHHYDHHYYVDKTKNPPRSIWRHPYDDQTYIDSLPPAERDRLSREGLLHPHAPTKSDPDYGTTSNNGGSAAEASSRPANAQEGASLGRKLKDRLTNSTHEERATRRREEAEQEEEALRSYKLFREGLKAATRTGKPHLLGVDDEGRELYLQPPGAHYPRVARENRLSPYVTEVIYEKGGGPQVGKSGARFVRADGLYEGGASLEDDMLNNPNEYGSSGQYLDPYADRGRMQIVPGGMGTNHLMYQNQFPGREASEGWECRWPFLCLVD